VGNPSRSRFLEATIEPAVVGDVQVDSAEFLVPINEGNCPAANGRTLLASDGQEYTRIIWNVEYPDVSESFSIVSLSNFYAKVIISI
jgi:hypothetical protein